MKNKIKEYIREQPVFKKIGIGAGMLFILISVGITAIYQDEVVKVWNKYAHSKVEKEDNIIHSDLATSLPETTFISTINKQIEDITQAYEDKSNTSFNNNVLVSNKIEGELNGEDNHERIYRAPRTGKYSFDFEIDDVNKGYVFYILDSKQEEKSRGYSYDTGVTVELQANMEYKLVVEHQEDEKVKYSITINVPEEVKNIEGGVIKDTIRYKDQENEYTYLAVNSGVYRFDFEIDDVNKEYYFYIYDSKNEELMSKSSSDDGGTIELSAGQVYKVKIVQREEMPQYSVIINKPNSAKDVSKNIIKGNTKFTDQLDIYFYEAPRTGKYRFDFEINDVNDRYDFIILDSKKKEIVNTNSYYEGKTIELEKGMRYEIHVIQNIGFAKYNVQIHVPDKAKIIDNNVLRGNIKYIDQQNIYYFTVKKTGRYCFKFMANNNENRYKITMYDSKNRDVFDTYSSDFNEEIELKKNEKYKVYICYFQGFGKYKASIKRV